MVELLLESFCFVLFFTMAAFLSSHVGKKKWMTAQTPYLQGNDLEDVSPAECKFFVNSA